MLREAIAYFFGISIPTGQKYVFIALALLNVALMLTLACRIRQPMWRIYLCVMAASTLLQGSPLWGLAGEVILATFGALWVWEMLPRDKTGKVFALAVGIMLASALMFALPRSWPKYDPARYFIRLYSVTGFAAACFGSVILPWTEKEQVNWNTAIAVPWFATVLAAAAAVNHDEWAYWDMAVSAKAGWTACLLAWLSLDLVQGRKVSAHIRTSSVRSPASEVPPQFPRG